MSAKAGALKPPSVSTRPKGLVTAPRKRVRSRCRCSCEHGGAVAVADEGVEVAIKVDVDEGELDVALPAVTRPKGVDDGRRENRHEAVPTFWKKDVLPLSEPMKASRSPSPSMSTKSAKPNPRRREAEGSATFGAEGRREGTAGVLEEERPSIRVPMNTSRSPSLSIVGKRGRLVAAGDGEAEGVRHR